MNKTNWEEQLKKIVPDREQRQKVIKFIREFQKEWKVVAKKNSKQKSLL